MKRFFLYTLIFCFFSDFSEAQNIPVGQWRYHGYCNNLKTVAVAGDRVFAASPYCLFYVDLHDNSIHTVSKVQGFSGANVSRLAYYEPLQLLVIAYDDGNIDIVKGQEIINISDIQRKQMVGSKKINHIHFHNDMAYLSADYGMSVLDLKKLQVSESFQNLGEDGQALQIFSSTVSAGGDSLFAVSAEGVMVGVLDPSVILMDRKNWYLYTPDDSLPDNVSHITAHNGRILVSVDPVYAADTVSNQGEYGIYSLQNGYWEKSPLQILGTVNGLASIAGRLFISHAAVLYETDLVSSKQYLGYANKPGEVSLDASGNIWVTDEIQGLYKLSADARLFKPSSLNSERSFKLYHYDGKIANFYGGYNGSYDNLVSFQGMGIFSGEGWQNLIPGNNFPYSYDLVSGAYNSFENTLYVASFGWGVIAVKDNGEYTVYNDDNSPLINAVPGAPFVKVGSLTVDQEGNLWVVNNSASSEPVLHKKAIGDTWTSYTIPSSISSYVPVELLTDDHENKWIRMRSRGNPGLVVFNENQPGSKHRFFYTTEGAGAVPSLAIQSMALDREGALWIGTDNGIAIMHDTYNAFSSDFQLPYFDGFPLLMGKYISAIEVDGGNRKWVGTKDGLWLFNPDASEVISHFTTDNSPLLSDEITDIEVNDVTGEVFISTSKGLISYRGTSTESEDNIFNGVKVFPNPVRENFEGLIGISGLATDSYVKITDISGKLIYETQAAGGTAVWNARNYNGEKAKTGIYLVFAVTPDGQEGIVGKVAVIE